jgi:WD40 repeat protein
MKLAFSLRGHTAPVTALAFLNESRLVSGSEDGMIIIWDISFRRPVSKWSAHKDSIISINTTSDMILSQSRDNSIKFWSLDGSLLDEIPCDSLHFCQSRLWKTDLMFCVDQKLFIYSISSKTFQTIALIEDRGSCTCLVPNEDGIYCGFEDGSVIYHSRDPSIKAVLCKEKHSEPVLCLTGLSDGRCISGGADNRIIIHGKEDSIIEMESSGLSALFGIIHGESLSIFTCGWNGSLLWYQNGFLKIEQIEHRKQGRCLSFLSVRNRMGVQVPMLAFGSEDERISVWDIGGCFK